MPRQKLLILYICHCYTTAAAAAATASTEISCVPTTAQSSPAIIFKFRSYVPCTKWTFGAQQFHLWPLGEQMCFTCVYSRDQEFSTDFLQIQTKFTLDQDLDAN